MQNDTDDFATTLQKLIADATDPLKQACADLKAACDECTQTLRDSNQAQLFQQQKRRVNGNVPKSH